MPRGSYCGSDGARVHCDQKLSLLKQKNKDIYFIKYASQNFFNDKLSLGKHGPE